MKNLCIYTLNAPVGKNSNSGFGYRLKRLIDFLNSRNYSYGIITEHIGNGMNININTDKNDTSTLTHSKKCYGLRALLSLLFRLFIFKYIRLKEYKSKLHELSEYKVIDFQSARFAAPYAKGLCKKGRKTILTVHYIGSEYLKSTGNTTPFIHYITGIIENVIFSRVNGLICLSSNDYKILSKKYTNVILIPQPSENTQSQSLLSAINNRILFVGTNMPANRDAIALLFEVSKLLRDFAFIVAGNISDYGQQMGLTSDNITYKGFVSKEELRKLYTECTYFIVPMTSGGGGSTKAIEALSYGKVVISTEIGMRGTDAVDGIDFIRCESLNEFTSAFKEIKNNDQRIRSFRENAVKLSRKFDKDILYGKYLDFVNNL